MREIAMDEIQKLQECLQALAEYHNAVSVNFKGAYPSRPYEETLKLFEKAFTEGTSRIAVVEDENRMVGFCKIDRNGAHGKLDYLVVQKAYRGKGYGKALMEWALQSFDRCGVHQIEVKVVDGNDVIHLYEKYGFQMNAHLLVCKR